jgi:hypothetical protein
MAYISRSRWALPRSRRLPSRSPVMGQRSISVFATARWRTACPWSCRASMSLFAVIGFSQWCLPRSLVFPPLQAGSHRSILFHQPIAGAGQAFCFCLLSDVADNEAMNPQLPANVNVRCCRLLSFSPAYASQAKGRKDLPQPRSSRNASGCRWPSGRPVGIPVAGIPGVRGPSGFTGSRLQADAPRKASNGVPWSRCRGYPKRPPMTEIRILSSRPFRP